eukprot:scaffold86437_cov62-Phaeocystis_antarctica.AAC.9
MRRRDRVNSTRNAEPKADYRPFPKRSPSSLLSQERAASRAARSSPAGAPSIGGQPSGGGALRAPSRCIRWPATTALPAALSDGMVAAAAGAVALQPTLQLAGRRGGRTRGRRARGPVQGLRKASERTAEGLRDGVDLLPHLSGRPCDARDYHGRGRVGDARVADRGLDAPAHLLRAVGAGQLSGVDRITGRRSRGGGGGVGARWPGQTQIHANDAANRPLHWSPRASRACQCLLSSACARPESDCWACSRREQARRERALLMR